MYKKLVLVDLDNYLIRNSLQLNKFAIQNLFKLRNRVNIWKRIDYIGTDSTVFKKIDEIFQFNLTQEQFSNLKRDYILELFKLIKRDPGAIQINQENYEVILDLIDTKDVIIGSFASSFFDIIRMKLVPLNIFHHFEFGAFGEDSTSPEELLKVAKAVLEIKAREEFASSYYLSTNDYRTQEFTWLNNSNLSSFFPKKEK